jgi:hypothetical protein
MLDLKTSAPNKTLYVTTTEEVFNVLNVSIVIGSYTTLIRVEPSE